MEYKCKTCGVLSEVATFRDIVRRKKLCEKHFNLTIKEQNGVLTSPTGSLSRDKPKKTTKVVMKCDVCSGYSDKAHSYSCCHCGANGYKHMHKKNISKSDTKPVLRQYTNKAYENIRLRREAEEEIS